MRSEAELRTQALQKAEKEKGLKPGSIVAITLGALAFIIGIIDASSSHWGFLSIVFTIGGGIAVIYGALDLSGNANRNVNKSMQ